MELKSVIILILSNKIYAFNRTIWNWNTLVSIFALCLNQLLIELYGIEMHKVSTTANGNFIHF